MSKINFTENQKDAINSRDGSVLVSAAAGSGKTAVLVERVIQRITDKKKPTDIDKMLIVTFTNAAADEMKLRINERLYQLIKNETNNNNLKRQQILLNRAHISTIDSFCSELVRENFYKLGIQANFKIADFAQMSVIKNEAMEKTLEYVYKNASKEFKKLIDVFNFGRDDKKLIQTIMILYSNIRSYPFPEKWLDEKLKMLDTSKDTLDTVWAYTVVEHSRQALAYVYMLAKENLSLSKLDEQIYSAYYKTLVSDEEIIRKLQKALEKEKWDDIRSEFINLSFDKLKVIRKCNDVYTKEFIQKNRKQIKDIISKKVAPLFENSDSENKEDLKSLKEISQQLFFATKIFSENLEQIKNEKNILDFSDLLHKSLKLLFEESEAGYKKTQFAKDLSQNFTEILVDEYQDINYAQNMLFYALSNQEKNIFSVGDAKQSIYRFRHARPEIFIKNKEKLNIYEKEKNNYPAKIILDKNFRSRTEILEAVNFVFSRLMSKESSGIDYNDEESLKFAADYYKDNEKSQVELQIIETKDKNNEEKTYSEAKIVAEKIIEIMQQEKSVSDGEGLRKATYGDFCILLRSPKNKARIFSEVLASYGIASTMEADGSFFSFAEIKTAISLLKVIDNPIQDVYLLSVLYSPIYSFTTDEISKIRLENKKESIYFSLLSYAEKEDALAKKCREFLLDIDYFRSLSVSYTADKLIYTVLEKTDYFSIVLGMKNGNDRLNNLRFLINYAKEYEDTTYKGLGSFVRYIDRLIEECIDIDSGRTVSENSNLVKIMSIHKSKGLEFPVCFLCDCSSPFHSIKEDIIINTDLGVALKLLNKKTNTLYSTLCREALLIKEKKENISEELRLLYVAMTRAKEKLIITATVENIKNKVEEIKLCRDETEKTSPFFVLSQNCYTSWLLSVFSQEILAYIENKNSSKKYLAVSIYEQDDIKTEKEDDIADDTKITNKMDTTLAKLLKARFDFAYKKSNLRTVPSKLSVTQISKTDMANTFKKPLFAEKTKLSSTDKGTALHTFMEFADFIKARENLEEEINRLKNKACLSKDDIEILDRNYILNFLSSKLCDRMINSNEIHREYSFKVLIEPSQVKKGKWAGLDEEKIVLRGCVDVLFKEDDKLVLVDYKSDKVKTMQELKDRYFSQIYMYKIAMQEIHKTKNIECNIYSFYLSDSISI